MALMTGAGGAGEERDMVMAMDQWQMDWMAMKIFNLPRKPPTTTSLFLPWQPLFYFIELWCGHTVLWWVSDTTLVKRRALCTISH